MTAIFKNDGNKCHRSLVTVYLKLESPETYISIPQLLLCMPYLLRYGDIEFGSHFEKWPSPRYAQFLKCPPPSNIFKPYVYITQINSQTSIPPKCLRAYRAGPGLFGALLNFTSSCSSPQFTCMTRLVDAWSICSPLNRRSSAPNRSRRASIEG